jgi:16S rRNA U516 pseudouridylate synthase RsuA-like enzyme
MFQSRAALKFVQRAIFDNRTLFSLSSSFSTVSASSKQTSEIQNRLSKIIATTGLCSRRQAEEWIKMGRVSVDGTICKSPSFIIDFQASVKSEEVPVEKDAERFDNNLRRHSILIDGVPLRWGYKVTNNPPKIWAIAKKKGEIVADKDDSKSRELVVERLKLHLSKETLERQTSFKPLYRLEYETEGLLMFTNSGDLARAMQKDPVAFPMRYRVRVHGLITGVSFSIPQYCISNRYIEMSLKCNIESKLSGLRKGLILSGKYSARC